MSSGCHTDLRHRSGTCQNGTYGDGGRRDKVRNNDFPVRLCDLDHKSYQSRRHSSLLCVGFDAIFMTVSSKRR
jgi:hypothetical protein